MIYFYHGFVAFGSDTIKSVPYALWMSDHLLFQDDFHISHLKEIIPNEQWIISWILHWFPSQLFVASFFFHMLFSIGLITGLLRFSDLILKNMEWSVLAVFVILFTLYNVNVSSNELYDNMLVASLPGKAAGIWALIFFYQKKFVWASMILGFTSILHPLVGIQLFIILTLILLLLKLLEWKKLDWKSILSFVLLFLASGGIWVAVFLFAQEMKFEGSTSRYFDIVEFRFGHHFFPKYFPISHLIILTSLTTVGFFQFYKRSKALFLFYTFAVLGILVHLIGIYFKWEFVLSMQWIKVTIWLKYFSVLAVLQLIQNIVEKKYHRLIFMVGFIVALLLAMLRFNPEYDTIPPLEMYAWVESQTSTDAIFMVPSTLSEFKAKTRRSSYFDYKAISNQQPYIFEWADRFQEVYGIQIENRGAEANTFANFRQSYGAGIEIINNEEIDYFIVPNKEQYLLLISRFEKAGKKRLFLGEEYLIYGQEESF